jgi:hypothetical protein
LRSIFPTDWADPLKFGPPAQNLGDLAFSPVIGQWKLWRSGFATNTDLAWLWPDGNVQWLVLLVGAAVLGTLGGAWAAWRRSTEVVGGEEAAAPSRPMLWLVFLLPLLLVCVWLGEVSRNPHYGEPERGYRAAIATICEEAGPNDAIVTVAPYAYQIPMNWLGGLCSRGIPIFGYAANSGEKPEAQQVLAQVVQNYDRIWFVTGGLPANDPENTVERWLVDMAYKAGDDWFDDFRLLRYATPARLAEAPLTPLGVSLVGTQTSVITLSAGRAPATARGNQVIPVEIYYELDAPCMYDLRWFVQLLSPEGYAVALLDTAPNDGYTLFNALPARQELVERAGLQLPPNLPPGDYPLIAGLYNPTMANAERLRTPAGGDFVKLRSVKIEAEVEAKAEAGR